jgi:hypothetical protein
VVILKGFSFVMRNLKSGICLGCSIPRNDLLKAGRGLWGYCTNCRKIKKREHQATLNRQSNLAVKQIVFEHYGNRCAYCGDTDFERLQIDHMANDGNEHRLTIGRNGCGAQMYRWLRRHNYPPGFQLLCSWCNVQKRGKTHEEFTKMSNISSI